MSQVLQCTQFDGFKLMRLPFGWLASSTISYTFAGQKFWQGLAVFLHAARVADVRVVDDQVRRLVFFVLRAGVIEVGELVEGQLAVALGRAKQSWASAPPSAGSPTASACARSRPSRG